jgi:hypothetical protein
MDIGIAPFDELSIHPDFSVATMHWHKILLVDYLLENPILKDFLCDMFLT